MSLRLRGSLDLLSVTVNYELGFLGLSEPAKKPRIVRFPGKSKLHLFSTILK